MNMLPVAKCILRIAGWFFVSLIVLVFLVTPVGYLTVAVLGDAMDWKSHYLAGLHSVNCGRVRISGDASVATECALDADAKGRPFRVAYQVQGLDSIVVVGIVSTPRGKLLALNYDSCPSGCGFSLLQQRVTVSSCPEPFHLYVNEKGRINCFQPQLSQPSNITSPNMESH
jgi:hypothetical protein